jgi:putative ABC transport system substrate-binding protein
VISRRRFTTGVVIALTPLGSTASAQEYKTQQARSTPRIARVFANTPEAEITGPNPTGPYIRAFLQAMSELGWTDGQNIAIERRSAEGRPERWDALVQDLIKSKVDLIVIGARARRSEGDASRKWFADRVGGGRP